MTVAGARTAPSHRRQGRPGGRSAKPVVVARVTLSVESIPLDVVSDCKVVADLEAHDIAPARRSDLHVARRQRRRDALVGLSVLVAALGTTVAVLDMIH
jgi:hypothetical protein